MMERHFTVPELAEMWGFSYDFIRDRVRDEPGVISTRQKNGRKKRGYSCIRVPQSIAEKVYGAMVNR